MDDAQLRTIWQQRQKRPGFGHLSQSLTFLMKRTLAKKVRQLQNLAEIWDEVIPQNLAEHTALESFSQGVLTVIVDSASHRFHLETLLRSGIFKEIQSRSIGAINRVKIVPGQFSSVDMAGQQRYEF